MSSRPADRELEVTLFGPGYGECSVVHVGNGAWVIVDSCIESRSNQPAALNYMQSIGVKPETDVKLVVATHWHDDHIRGLSTIVNACTAAEFACPIAMTKKEFLAHVKLYNSSNPIKGSSGLREIDTILNRLVREKRHPVYSISNRVLLEGDLGGGLNPIRYRLLSLSPTDARTQQFLTTIAKEMPTVRQTKMRCPTPGQNDVSIVLWLDVGGIGLLLGGDLEHVPGSDLGWDPVVKVIRQRGDKASYFKIPHHGSVTGHCDDVWKEALGTNCISTLTPWNKNAGLPQKADVARIVALTERAYCSSGGAAKPSPRRPPAVQRTLRELPIRVWSQDYPTGAIRARKNLDDQKAEWTIELINGAIKLSEFSGKVA